SRAVCRHRAMRASTSICSTIVLPHTRRPTTSRSSLRSSPTCLSRISLALVATVWATAGYALDPQRAMSQYLRSRWTAETGFPGGPVYAIAQSADGYLWVAAERGLVRFDGIRFQLIHPYDSASGLDTTAISLAPRAEDGLWAQLRRGAFVRYRNGTLDHVLRTADHPTSMVTAMAPGRHRTMLVADVTRGLVRVADDRMDVLVPSTAMPWSHVIWIAETEGGAILLGTRDAGVFLVNDARAASIRMSLPDRKINALLAQDRSRLWIATDNGVTRWNVDATP